MAQYLLIPSPGRKTALVGANPSHADPASTELEPTSSEQPKEALLPLQV